MYYFEITQEKKVDIIKLIRYKFTEDEGINEIATYQLDKNSQDCGHIMEIISVFICQQNNYF